MDDGSGSEYRNLFDRLSQYSGVHVLRHAINLGKGAALKTAINFALVQYPGWRWRRIRRRRFGVLGR